MAAPSSSVIITLTFIITFTLMPTTTISIPYVVFHGISDQCDHKSIQSFTEILTNWSGSQGHCVEIGNGVWDSWFMPLSKQVSVACDKVKNMSELNDGYNIVGLSQGNMVGRGVIEFCDGPPVRNLISLAGPHSGIASVPLCGSGLLCIIADFIMKFAVYSKFVQEHLAPAGYIKIPIDIDDYRKGCKFLPKLNNEIHRNATYKKQFDGLHKLVLIMFEEDEVLVPRETSLFGYFPDGSLSKVLPAQETMLYKEDWIGLRTLDEAGKVKFINISGSHLEISLRDIKKHIVPYLVEDKSAKLTKVESSLGWSSSFLNLDNNTDWPREEKLLLRASSRDSFIKWPLEKKKGPKRI